VALLVTGVLLVTEALVGLVGLVGPVEAVEILHLVVLGQTFLARLVGTEQGAGEQAGAQQINLELLALAVAAPV
jgi:hypothetical protein